MFRDSLSLLAQSGGSFWLPPPGSTTAPVVDNIFYLILSIATFFFLLIVVLMTVFVILYRRREGVAPGVAPSHNTPLEVAWTVVPVGIVAMLFYLGFNGYMDMRTMPREGYEIRVIGQKWKWLFQYPNGHVDENLHVPVAEPVRLTMTSEDVIHSLFIPAFRVKMDVVPGRYTQTWFQALEPGAYDLYCSEYCGTGHSDMLAKVIVHKPGEFKKWLAEAGDFMKNKTPAQAGEELYRRRGCAQCHSTDGTARANGGPSFKGIYGKRVDFEDGTSATADDNYLRESILDPQAKIVAGYRPIMPTYKGLVNDREITAIIEFIKSLK